MSNPFNIELIVDNVKNIINNNRCAICDKLEGSRARYPCGHTACTDCVDNTGNCILCLTPPLDTFADKPLLDEPSTLQAVNASVLLNACQEIFKIDVYRKQRISEQLKIEKELFPKCIQAPNKYFNKKRASDEENKSKRKRCSTLLFLGEDISSFDQTAMDNKRQVEEWLVQNHKSTSQSHREPFADLNVNNQSFTSSTPVKKRVGSILDNVKENSAIKKKDPNRKRTHFKTAHSSVKSHLGLDKYMKSVEKGDLSGWNNAKKFKKDFHQNVQQTKVKEESGIVIDDETIVRDETQDNMIDKDKLACLAVIEASEYEENASTDVKLNNSKISKDYDVKNTLRSPNQLDNENDNILHKNVRFYKRSYLIETCKNCKKYIKNNITSDGTASQSHDVSITIENKSIITTIKLSECKTTKCLDKHSTSVQTEITDAENFSNNVNISKLDLAHQDILVNKILPITNSKNDNIVISQDIFTDDIKNIDNLEKSHDIHEPTDESGIYDHTSGGLIIDSSSDSDIVSASSNQFSQYILTEVEVHPCPIRRALRRPTPDTSDSSEKENLDPNRNKKQRLGNKKKY